MKTINPKRAMLRATPVAAAVAALLSTTAFAQTTPATETITVTGIRRGIESAISVKKNSDGVVEAISAEDIGKLPDTTIAESLARLPGVTTQRTRSGQASTINIRGLGPDFTGYLLNGREQTTVGDSRGVDLSVYPAELIGGATVFKTADAALLNAGLAGTIDNKLIDPLTFSNRVIAGSVQQDKTGQGLPVEGKGKRYSLTYVDQFADRTIGLALGFVHADGTSNELGTGGWGGATVQATLANGTVVPGVKLPEPFGGGLDYKNRRVRDDRDGFAAILSYKPSKEFSAQLDLFSAKAKTDAKEARLQGPLGTNITNATVVGGVATKGTFAIGAGPTNGGLIDRSEIIFDDDKINSLGAKATWKFAQGWQGSVDLSSNSAKRVQRDIEAYAGIATADTFSFDTTGGGTPQFAFGKPLSYTDPALIKIRDQTGWSGIDGVPQAGYSKGPTIKDKLSALRFDLKTDLPDNGYVTDIQFGGNYSKRTKDRITDEGLIVSTTGGGKDAIPFPSSAYVATNIGGTGLNMLTFDPGADLWPGATILRKYNDDILSKTWSVEEKVLIGYVKGNIDATVGGIPMRGNVGVQVVNTDQSSAGYRAEVGSGVVLANPAGKLTTDGTKYTDVLPSLNLTGDLGSGYLVRFGLGRLIARPNLTDMRNSFAASVATDAKPGDFLFNKFVGSAGNPNLKPFKATGLDLSFEKYFGNKGYIGIAGFYKKLDSYIATQSNVDYDFTAYANQLGIKIPTRIVDPATGRVLSEGGARGLFTTSVNASGGNVSGAEVTASVPLGLVASFLDGFGFQASYSATSSSIKLPNLIGLNPNQRVPNDSLTISVPGLSKTNTKLMVYYEAYGFSVFVAHNERSDYVGSVANDTTGGYPTLKNIQGSAWVSAQIGYEFQDGFAKGLGLRVEGNNLNKPTYRQLNRDGTLDTENKTGSSISFKLSYKYQ
jgi:iron complex outermembrane recepter protein